MPMRKSCLGAPAYGHPTYNGNPIMAYKKKLFALSHLLEKLDGNAHAPSPDSTLVVYFVCVCDKAEQDTSRK